MNNSREDFPLDIKISFEKLFDHYREEFRKNPNDARAKEVIDLAKKHPILTTGLVSEKDFEEHKDKVDVVLKDIFSPALSLNEIKVATAPFSMAIFKYSERFKNIINAAGDNFVPSLTNFNEDQHYIMGCSIILNIFYGFKIDFRRPFYYKIPDAKGFVRTYRVVFNGDFVEILKNENSPEITQKDVDELIENFDNVALWKEKFPPSSWEFKGFIIANMFDVTTDAAISDFKAHLLEYENKGEGFKDEIEQIFRTIFNCPDLMIGFSDFNEEDGTFEKLIYKEVNSYILNGESSEVCEEALCDVSFYKLFKNHELYCITNTEKYHKLYPDNVLYKKLLDQGILSAIFVSIVHNDKVLGVFELVSPTINALNTINAHKLTDVMPFLINSAVHSKEQIENELELIIQEECTSIHQSVHWKFKKEAKRFLANQNLNNPTYFREIVFDDVFPLYGQIDVKGSSEARNIATQKDLQLQLKHIQKIINKIYKLESLPIYEQMEFRIHEYLKELKNEFQVDSERQVLNFIRTEIIPLFSHLSKKNDALKAYVEEYYELIEKGTGLVYQHRKEYDDSVMQINKEMASLLDKKQIEAQQMYPHYFERFKTDGVEHNLYIGESITKHKSFNKVYLYNLRLWQLQVMCEMENSYYSMKENLPMPLDVASMILAFNSSLSLRFRMDEKRFDVDGTYNARYEVVKKRVDKANIKGTEERITQPGKISIVYSQKEDEREYLKYIKFLQHKKVLSKEIEIVELEDLQGVTGLKAIRVSVLYSKKKENNKKEYYTYNDLMDQLQA